MLLQRVPEDQPEPSVLELHVRADVRPWNAGLPCRVSIWWLMSAMLRVGVAILGHVVADAMLGVSCGWLTSPGRGRSPETIDAASGGTTPITHRRRCRARRALSVRRRQVGPAIMDQPGEVKHDLLATAREPRRAR